ncbi:MAG: hypothetical protein KBD63_07885 [Bacteriovoracaceae bacterium]|nr:hypothetical protein [Bacteriovoracaceae bacterium]
MPLAEKQKVSTGENFENVHTLTFKKKVDMAVIDDPIQELMNEMTCEIDLSKMPKADFPALKKKNEQSFIPQSADEALSHLQEQIKNLKNLSDKMKYYLNEVEMYQPQK